MAGAGQTATHIVMAWLGHAIHVFADGVKRKTWLAGQAKVASELAASPPPLEAGGEPRKEGVGVSLT